MGPDQHLRSAQPLAGLSAEARRARYLESGMHSPNPEIRVDVDAFEIREDVSVEDACLTAQRLMKMAVAQLELLGTSADLAPSYREVVEGVACIGRLASGTMGLVLVALCRESAA